jgi:hypothetical protein
MTNIQTEPFGSLEIEDWNLFDILGFGAWNFVVEIATPL